jgi:hypothetical protein
MLEGTEKLSECESREDGTGEYIRGFAEASLGGYPPPLLIAKCVQSIDSICVAGDPDGQKCERVRKVQKKTA